MSRAEGLRERKPELVVELRLYSTDQGGKTQPIKPGWGCPCTIQEAEGTSWVGYDAWPLLDAEMEPGQSRIVGLVFLSGLEAAAVFRRVERFFLWEGRIIGEAKVIKSTIAREGSA